MSFPNVYTHRKVADTAARSCEVCYKLSTSVLITPEKQDFFYVCPAHLKDKGFCSPVVDQAAVEARKKKEMEEEVERVRKEYEEKQRKKKESEAEKDKKDKDKDKDEKKDEDEKKKSDEKEKEKDKTSSPTDSPAPEEEPRVFALQRTFYSRRVEKKRQAEIAKRNRERLQNPNLFPSVPKGQP